MPIVIALIGYGTFLYGYEATGLFILGVAIGALKAEQRRDRLTADIDKPTMTSRFLLWKGVRPSSPVKPRGFFFDDEEA